MKYPDIKLDDLDPALVMSIFSHVYAELAEPLKHGFTVTSDRYVCDVLTGIQWGAGRWGSGRRKAGRRRISQELLVRSIDTIKERISEALAHLNLLPSDQRLEQWAVNQGAIPSRAVTPRNQRYRTLAIYRLEWLAHMVSTLAVDTTDFVQAHEAFMKELDRETL